MTRQQFQRLVERTIRSIPSEFLMEIDNLTFLVEDWPDHDILREAGFDNPLDLLGFYRGCPLPDRSLEFPQGLPDQIIIFQKPIENHARQSGDPVTRVVRETVVHELAHYFGFSEEEMDLIEEGWSRQTEEAP